MNLIGWPRILAVVLVTAYEQKQKAATLVKA
jgi:hypothetical protein